MQLRKIIMFLGLLILSFTLHSCKKDCPEKLPDAIVQYIKPLQENGLTYVSQYGEEKSIPGLGEPYTEIRLRPYQNVCYLESFISSPSYSDTLSYFGFKISGEIYDKNYYNYSYYINLGNSELYNKYYGFYYAEDDKPIGYTANISTDSTIYHETYSINGVIHAKVFQVILKDTSKSVPFLKQYFFNKEKTFIRLDERLTDKVWVLK